MSKRIAWLAAAGLTVTSVAMGVWNYREANKPVFLRGEHEEEELGRPPVDGDFWAIRVGYGGDPHNMRFEPRWMLQAKAQDARIASGVPSGDKTYRKPAGASLQLDPNAFTLLGPLPLAGEGFGAGNNAGRTNVLLGDPDDPTIAYLGSDGGGVWKTTNCCSTSTVWEVKTDFPEIASMSIGDISYDPNDHNVLYAGTGDLRYGSFTFGSAGVLKSTDKGETWVVLGEDVFNPFYGPSAGGFPQYQAISKVVVDPNDSNNVVVGTKTGVFFSYDAGANWTGPCYTNNFSGGATPQRQDTTGVLVLNQSGTSMVYAAIGTRGFPTPVQPDLGNNGANGVYRTTMPTSGCPAVGDWALLNNGWPAAAGSGTPNTTLGRIELAAAPTDSLTIYAMASDANNGTRSVQGVYKSTDGGTTWTQTGTPSSFTGCGGAGSQMWYDAGITVSPTDANVVFASTVDLFRSTNGGTNFSNLTNAYCGGPVHPDNHARAFIGGDPNKLINGNDGGVYYNSNAMGAAAWVAMNDTLPTIEVYHGDITANFATSASSGVTGGFQDNGSATATFTGTQTATTWNATYGGDGIVSRIEPVLGQRWYYSSQNGDVVVSTNGPNAPDADASGGWSGDVLSFIFPFDIYRYGALDAAGSGCTSAQGCTHLIAGSNRLWETTTGGVNGSGWAAKTGNLTKNNLILGGDNRSFINNLHYAVNDPTVAVVGTNDGNFQYVYNLGGSGAATNIDVTGDNVILPNRPIMDVATDPSNAWIGYAAIGGFSENTPSTPGHVYQSVCTTQCTIQMWMDVSGNLPDIPANAIIANPNMPGQVFVGTDWGLYYTDNINALPPVWQRFEGLPHVMVWSLSIDRGFTTLAAYTRSRGVWAWPLPQPATGTADLAVTVDAPAFGEPGNQLDYTITVVNNGPSAATNVQVDSTVPPGFTSKGNSGDCTTDFPCVFPTLAVGASVSITSGTCVPRDFTTDPIQLTASVTSDTVDPNSANNGTTPTVPLIIPDFLADGFDCP